MFLTKSMLNELNTLQGKHIKTVLGLHHNVRSTPLMEALDIPSVSTMTGIGALNLLKACLQSNSVTSLFYTVLMRRQCHINMRKCLLGHINDILKNKNIALCQYLLNSDKIVSMFKYKIPNGVNGYIDTIRYFLR